MDIGAQLRSAREALGFSLAFVAQKTRVQPRIISAIEHNDLASLPPRPFGRGFIRAYAREVGLDPDSTVQEYFAQFGSSQPLVREPAEHGTGWPHRGSWVAPAAMVAVLGLIVLAVLRGGVDSEAPRSDPAAGSTVAPASASAPAPRDPVGTTGSTPVATTGVALRLIADRQCWVSASVDGKRALYQLLSAGAEHTLQAEQEVALRAGDAGALRVGVNGRAPERFGADGSIRTARFTPDGTGAAVR